VTGQALLNVNGIQDPHRIYPGQSITLPGFEGETQLAVVEEAEPVAEPAIVVTLADDVAEVPEPVEEPVAAEENVQLALNETPLPPAAVLPDNQELDAPVTLEEEQAVALDPELDVAQSNEQLTDLLAADPSDYSVASNNSIEIQASETLGHYADWLGVRAWDLRRLNNMAFTDPVIIGDRLRLDFSRVNIVEFERTRREFHSSLQAEFFANYRIQDVERYRINRGDNIGNIARTRYSTPIWLLRQYNPELDFNRIQIGQEVVFPLLELASD